MDELVFHVGHHKTGTTWLQSNYFQNNYVFNLLNDYRRPWEDELCINIIQAEKFNVKKCKEIIRERRIPGKYNIISTERLSGHPISGGYDAPKIAKRLYQIDSNAKVIITTRDPKSFVVSVYKQMIKEGYCGKFNDFVKINNWKTCGPSRYYFLQKKIVIKYNKLFNKKNVLLLNFDEFRINRTGYINKINEFLSTHIVIKDDVLNEIINKGYSNKKLRALRLLNKYRKTELNPFTVPNLNTPIIFRLAKIVSLFCSDKTLIDKNALRELFK